MSTTKYPRYGPKGRNLRDSKARVANALPASEALPAGRYLLISRDVPKPANGKASVQEE
jgi:hypothetical protein